MIPVERQIPFPLETAKGDVPKRHEFLVLGKRYLSLLEVSPLCAPGKCDLRVGPGPDSAECTDLNIEEGRLLLELTAFQLLRGKSSTDALEMAVILMMFRES